MTKSILQKINNLLASENEKNNQRQQTSAHTQAVVETEKNPASAKEDTPQNESTLNLFQLPIEVLIHIASFLDIRSLAKLMQTSRVGHTIAIEGFIKKVDEQLSLARGEMFVEQAMANYTVDYLNAQINKTLLRLTEEMIFLKEKYSIITQMFSNIVKPQHDLNHLMQDLTITTPGQLESLQKIITTGQFLDNINTLIADQQIEPEMNSYVRLRYITRVPLAWANKHKQQLNNLQSFHITNSCLNQLPNELLEGMQIRKLEVINSQLKAVPKAITNLANLATLNLTGNRLINLPQEITNLPNTNLPKLTVLMLDNNPLACSTEESNNLTPIVAPVLNQFKQTVANQDNETLEYIRKYKTVFSHFAASQKAVREAFKKI